MMTPRQRQLFDLLSKAEADGHSPSLVELGSAMGYRSKSSIHRLIDGLEERGLVERLPGRWRAVRIIKPADPAACNLATVDIKDLRAELVRRGYYSRRCIA